MQITDEMVSTAVAAYWQSGSKIILSDTHMRAALEAALGARSVNAPKLISNMRKNAGPDTMLAAACIEDLAEALKPFADSAAKYDPPEEDDNYWSWDPEVVKIGWLRTARAVLERWGLK